MENIGIKLSADISVAQANIRRLSDDLKRLQAQQDRFNQAGSNNSNIVSSRNISSSSQNNNSASVNNSGNFTNPSNNTTAVSQSTTTVNRNTTTNQQTTQPLNQTTTNQQTTQPLNQTTTNQQTTQPLNRTTMNQQTTHQSSNIVGNVTGRRVGNNTTNRQGINDINGLRQQVTRLQDIRASGADNKNIINKREFEEFRQLQAAFNKDYGKYINNMLTQARNLKTETQKLKAIINSETDDNAKRIYEQKLEDLETQKKMIEINIGNAKKLRSDEKEIGKDVDTNMEQGSDKSQNLIGDLSKNLLTLGMLIKGTQMAWNYAKDGSKKSINADEAVYHMSNRVGVYDGDYSKGSEELALMFKDLGYSPEETAQMAQQYIGTAGVKDYNTMLKDVRGIQEFSKAYSIDESQYTNTAGKLTQMGAVKEGDQRKFANLIAESIKSSGMTGREDEQIQVIQQLADNLNSNRVGVSENEMLTGMNLYGKLAQSNDAFKGEKGMSIVNQINGSMVNGGPVLDTLMGWNTKYQGMDGRWQFELQKAKGISDPENLSTIIESIENVTGEKIEDNSYGKSILATQLNLSAPVIDEITSNEELMDGIRSGTYGKEELDKILGVEQAGKENIENLVNDYVDSNLGVANQFNETVDETKRNLGSKINEWVKPLKDWRNNLSSEENLAVDIGGGAFKLGTGAFALNKIIPLVKGLFAGGSVAAGVGAVGTASAGATAASTAGVGATAVGAAGGGALASAVVLPAAILGAMGFKKYRKKKFDDKVQSIIDEGGTPNRINDNKPWYDLSSLFGSSDEDVVDLKKEKEEWSERQANMTFSYPDVYSPVKPQMKSFESLFASSDKKQKYEDDMYKWNKSMRELNIDKQRYYTAKELYKEDKSEELPYEDYKNNIEYWKTNENIDQSTGKRINKVDGNFAVGKDYIPYDGMVARLHRGEAVLRNDEAKKWRNNEARTSIYASSSSEKNPTNTIDLRTQQNREFKESLTKEESILSKRSDLLNMERNIVEEKDTLNYKNSQQLNDVENKIKKLTSMLNNTSRAAGLLSLLKTSGTPPSRNTSYPKSSVQQVSDYRWSGEYEKEYGSGTEMKLRRKSNITTEQMNELISKEAQRRGTPNSDFIGHGADFIKAYEETGIHPIDLLSHATEETGFGISSIAKDKNNYFGIGAFDSSPYASAYSFGNETDNNSKVSAGIVEGSKWIARNYVDKGQDTYNKMRHNNGVHEYATNNSWDTNITSIRNRYMGMLPDEVISPVKPEIQDIQPKQIVDSPVAPVESEQYKSTAYSPEQEQKLYNTESSSKDMTINVHVNGKIDNMNEKNQDKITDTFVNAIKTSFDTSFTDILGKNIKREER